MTKEDLLEAIEETRREIYQIKQLLDQDNDPREERRMEAKLKELQIRQLWLLDQTDGW